MDKPSDSRAPRVLVWDLPVRIFHWALVASFAGAWLTAESRRWEALHVTLGYTVGLLVAFRILWGFAGTRHARFSQFVKGPSAVLAYLGSMLRGRPAHFVGHNPAGAVAIVALLVLAALTSATGFVLHEGLVGEWAEDLHEALAGAMLGVAVVHVAGVVLGSLLHRENLVRAMFTGRKAGTARDAIASPRRAAALVLVGLLGGLWWLQAQQDPADAHARLESRAEEHEKDED